MKRCTTLFGWIRPKEGSLVALAILILVIGCNGRSSDDYPFADRDKRFVELAAYRMIRLQLGQFNRLGFREAVIEPKDVVCEKVYYSPDHLKIIAASITTVRGVTSGGPYQLIPLIGQRDSIGAIWKLYTWNFYTFTSGNTREECIKGLEKYMFGSGLGSLREQGCFVLGQTGELVPELVGFPADDDRFWSSTNLLWRKDAGGKGLYYYQALGTRAALYPNEVFPEYTLDVPDSLKREFQREYELLKQQRNK